jgi:hypothetical protein
VSRAADGHLIMRDALLLPVDQSVSQIAVPADITEVADAAAVRRMPLADLARRHPVHLRGTVTFYDPRWALLFVQDRTAGVYVNTLGARPTLTVGDDVAVDGMTDAGGFAPAVVGVSVRRLITTSWPTAVVAPLDDLLASTEDAQLIEVSGIIRRVWRDDASHLFYDLVTGVRGFMASLRATT